MLINRKVHFKNKSIKRFVGRRQQILDAKPSTGGPGTSTRISTDDSCASTYSIHFFVHSKYRTLDTRYLCLHLDLSTWSHVCRIQVQVIKVQVRVQALTTHVQVLVPYVSSFILCTNIQCPSTCSNTNTRGPSNPCLTNILQTLEKYMLVHVVISTTSCAFNMIHILIIYYI